MNLDYADALSNFAALADSKTGIIRSVELVKLLEADPAVFLAHAEPCDTTPLTGIRGANRGAACSVTPERAIVRACGESVERYCSSFFNLSSMRLTSARELSGLGERCIEVHDLYPFAEWQYCQPGFPYKRVADTDAIRWVRGRSVRTEETVWIPASCVYVPYFFDAAVEPFTHMSISTGLAAGTSLDYCVAKGICEIVERDSLMLVWHFRIAAPSIEVESCRGLSDDIDMLLDAARPPQGPAWYLNLLTLDINIPVISAALIDPGSPPLTSFGIGADMDPVHALRVALEEAALTRVLVNRRPEIEDQSRPFDRLRTLRDHLLAHAATARLRDSLSFLTHSNQTCRFEDLRRRWPDGQTSSLADRLAESGHEAVWCEVTTPDVREYGFCVARTVIPSMQPLDDDHHCRHLGGTRLTSTAVRLGWSEFSPDKLNPDPHPFP